MRKGKGLLRRGVLAAVSALPASTTFATQMIFDVRASDGTHAVSATAAGQTLSADIFLLIAGADANLANDVPSQGEFSLNTSTGGLLGNLSMTLAAPFNSAISNLPVAADIDGDTDLELGPGAGAASSKSDIVATVFSTPFATVESAALAPETIGGVTYSKFKLGTASITIKNQIFTAAESTTLSLTPRTGTSTTKPQKFWIDSTTTVTSMLGNDSRILLSPLTVNYTGPVTLTWSPGGATGGNGTWDLASHNWSQSTGMISWPNNSSTAVFGNTAGTVDLSGTSITAGCVRFDVPGYVLDGPAGTTLNASMLAVNADATIAVPVVSTTGLTKTGVGTVTLAAPSTYTGGTIVSAGTLAVTTGNGGAITGAGMLLKTGTGAYTAANLTLSSLSIQSGTLQIAPHGAAPSTLASLSISPGAALDLNDNSLIVSYTGTSPAPAIRALLASGFNFGEWNGPGIFSSTVNADASYLSALGYIDSGSSITIKPTLYGDNNLDGVVNATDFQMFLDGLVAASGSSWALGDYTYDGKVDLGNDFNLFLMNYLRAGNSLGALAPIVESDSALSVSQKSQLLALVPEPAGIAPVAIIAAAITLKRRRAALIKP
jgi:autotransporter-associated beta strand protein